MSRRRREYLAGTALVGAGLVAGCTGGTGSDDDGTPTGTGETTTTGTPAADGSRTVEMAPVGEVTLEEPPESVANYFPGYADMAVALGHGDTINSTASPSTGPR